MPPNSWVLLPLCLQSGVLCVGTSSYFSGSGSVTHEVTPEQNLSGMALIVISQVELRDRWVSVAVGCIA